MIDWILSNMPFTVWVALGVLFLIIEAITVSTVSIWFVGGCAAAAIIAGIGGPIWLQAVSAAAISALLIVTCRRMLTGLTKKENTIEDKTKLEGRTAVVSQTIPAGGMGQICLDDVFWNAHALSDNEELAEGTRVIIIRRDGVRCIVEKFEELT